MIALAVIFPAAAAAAVVGLVVLNRAMRREAAVLLARAEWEAGNAFPKEW